MGERSVICVAVELDGMFAEDVAEGEELYDEEQRLQGPAFDPCGDRDRIYVYELHSSEFTELHQVSCTSPSV